MQPDSKPYYHQSSCYFFQVLLPDTACTWVPNKLLQSCLTLCNPIDYSQPSSSVHEILQARSLEWVVMPSSRGSSWPRDQSPVSLCLLYCRQVLYHECHLGSPQAAQLSTKHYKEQQNTREISLKRQRNNQNQFQLWQRCWKIREIKVTIINTPKTLPVLTICSVQEEMDNIIREMGYL